MTDRIDLDERTDDQTDESAEAQDSHPDDWIWRDHADPPIDDPADAPSDAAASTSDRPQRDSEPDEPAGSGGDTASGSSERRGRSVPHVPHPDKGKPAGIPVEGGGSGGGAGTSSRSNTDSSGRTSSTGGHGEPTGDQSPSGPHGRDADDMTMAFTFDAIQRFANPAAVLADAGRWTDWIGIVGDVDAHVLNKFQRDQGLDVDFFNGTGTGPGERLAEIGPHSMFFADRMVVVGLGGQDEHVADAADWEFVPIETAAAEADWELTED